MILPLAKKLVSILLSGQPFDERGWGGKSEEVEQHTRVQVKATMSPVKTGTEDAENWVGRLYKRNILRTSIWSDKHIERLI